MSDPQKTERATPKRLREAREKGELPRSRELSTAIVVATGVVALMVSGAGMAAKAADWLKLALQPDPAMLADSSRMLPRVGELVMRGFAIVLPLPVAGVVAAFVGPPRSEEPTSELQPLLSNSYA